MLLTLPYVSLKDTRPSEAIKKIVEACQASSVVSVVYQKEVTYEEVNVEQNIKNFCKNSGIKVSFEINVKAADIQSFSNRTAML